MGARATAFKPLRFFVPYYSDVRRLAPVRTMPDPVHARRKLYHLGDVIRAVPRRFRRYLPDPPPPPEFAVTVAGETLAPELRHGDRVTLRPVPDAHLDCRIDANGGLIESALSPGQVVYVEARDGGRRLKVLRRLTRKSVTVGNAAARKHVGVDSWTYPREQVNRVSVVVGVERVADRRKGRAA